MSLTINNNSVAFNTWTSFSANSKEVARSMGHLSTGVKMVADDPSGVGISERMRSQSRNVAMGRANVDNGLSLLQTVDSWLQKMNDMLGRMSELTIEHGDGTKSNTDKANIQTEFKQLQKEMVRVTSHNDAAAKFNGLYLFRGGNGVSDISSGDGDPSGNVSLQLGPDQSQKINLELKDLQVDSTENIGSISTATQARWLGSSCLLLMLTLITNATGLSPIYSVNKGSTPAILHAANRLRPSSKTPW